MVHLDAGKDFSYIYRQICLSIAATVVPSHTGNMFLKSYIQKNTIYFGMYASCIIGDFYISGADTLDFPIGISHSSNVAVSCYNLSYLVLIPIQ